MFRKFIMTAITCGYFIVNSSFAAETLLFGVPKDLSSTNISTEYRAAELAALQKATDSPVEFKVFPDYLNEIQAIQNDPKLITFTYIKASFINEFSKLKGWKKIAGILTRDPVTHQLKSTYNAYIITAKNSSIRNLEDLSDKTIVYYNPDSNSNYFQIKKLLSDKKIAVKWIKARDLDQSLALIDEGKADALGAWDQLYYNNPQMKNTKVIYQIKHLPNPAFFVNTNNVDAKTIEKVTAALKAIGTQNPNFTYK